jgi:hypothetical protein
MAAAAHNPSFAKKAGIPVSVAKEFNQADKGKKFKEGGNVANLKKMFKGKETYSEELKEGKAIKSGKLTPQQYAKGERMEDSKKMKSDDKKMKSGGSCYAKGGVTRADGCATKGHTKGKMMAEGGRVGRGGVKGDNIVEGAKDLLKKRSEFAASNRKAISDAVMEPTGGTRGRGATKAPIFSKNQDQTVNRINLEREPKFSPSSSENSSRADKIMKSVKGSEISPELLKEGNDILDKANAPTSDGFDEGPKKVTMEKPKPKAASKPKPKTEGQKAREQIERMRSIYNSDSEYSNDEDSGMKRGGKVKSCGMKGGGVTRGDGIASRGRTRGKFV